MAKNEIDTPLAQSGDLTSLLMGLRDKMGYTTAETADAMCLSEQTIRRLENEEFELLAEPPYIRGYLRNYAKLADTDADELITVYESLRGADPSELKNHFKKSPLINSREKRGLSPVLLQLVFLALLLGALVAVSMIPAVNQWIKSTWDNFSKQTTSQSVNDTDNPLLTGTMPVPLPLPADTSPSNKKKTTPVALAKKEEGKTEVNTSNANKKVTANDKAPTQEANKAETLKAGGENKNEALIPSSSDGTIKIKLVFNKEVWMRIKDKNKKTVFEGQNRSGQEKVLELKKPLTFRVGNAQGLSLFVNDKAVDISRYIKGSVANFTLE